MPNEPLRVLIADQTPMNRHLVRFFLENDGIEVLAETARADEAESLAAKLHPDAVILDSDLADMGGLDAIPRIRDASPSSKVVMFSPTASAPAVAPPAGADAYLETGVGLKELAIVLGSLCGLPVPETVRERAPAATVPRLAPRPPRRWVASLWPALAALSVTVALVVSRVAPQSFTPPTAPAPRTVLPTSPPDQEAAAAYLEAAMEDLRALIQGLPGGSPRQVAALARDLMEQRAAAVAAGADASELDALIAERLPALLPGLPPETVLALHAILGPLLPGGGGFFALGQPPPPASEGPGTAVISTEVSGGGLSTSGSGGGPGGSGGGGGTVSGGGGSGDGGSGGDTTGGSGGTGGAGGDTTGGEGEGGSDEGSGQDQDSDEQGENQGDGSGDQGQDSGSHDNGNHGHDNGNHYGWDRGVGNPH